jgi:long-chain acyl-CoA synthetase
VNVADLVRDSAAAYPAKPAIIFQSRPIAYGELDELVDLTASALASLGVKRGDRVALLIGNVPEFASCLYGAIRIGAVACPLNVTLTPEELGYILADAGAKAVITELSSVPGLLSIRDRLADLQSVLVIGGPPAPHGTLSLEEALSDQEEPPDVKTDANDLAVIAYTAGTTAAPKGAMLTHGNLLASLEQMSSVSTLAVSSSDVVFSALPLFHIYALNVVLDMAMRSGATAVLVERFDPRESFHLVASHAVTVLVGAPPMFTAWLALPSVPGELSSVRLAVSGAAPLPGGALDAFRRRFGITIWEGYGLTEAAPTVTSNALAAFAKPGSIGLPMPGLEVRLVDEAGEDVEEGDPGELLVRGPNVFAGYWNRPEETAAVLEGEWLKSGDVAFRDEEGYLFLVDRKKDLIIVSGFNVFPKEVEDAIALHPKVAEAAVIGVPDDRTGETIQAWVVPEDGEVVTPEELLDFLHGYLARFKWPKEIRIVDELPRHTTGKILRRILRGEQMLGTVEEVPEA